jgi:hypothetical protein
MQLSAASAPVVPCSWLDVPGHPDAALIQVTGIASTADYLEYLPGADEFRKHAPGCATPSRQPQQQQQQQQAAELLGKHIMRVTRQLVLQSHYTSGWCSAAAESV